MLQKFSHLGKVLSNEQHKNIEGGDIIIFTRTDDPSHTVGQLHQRTLQQSSL